MSGRWMVEYANPPSFSKETKPVIEITSATSPKSRGVSCACQSGG
jgi:hypothetical protein